MVALPQALLTHHKTGDDLGTKVRILESAQKLFLLRDCRVLFVAYFLVRLRSRATRTGVGGEGTGIRLGSDAQQGLLPACCVGIPGAMRT